MLTQLTPALLGSCRFPMILLFMILQDILQS
jgi:hypothetical protein